MISVSDIQAFAAQVRTHADVCNRLQAVALRIKKCIATNSDRRLSWGKSAEDHSTLTPAGVVPASLDEPVASLTGDALHAEMQTLLDELQNTQSIMDAMAVRRRLRKANTATLSDHSADSTLRKRQR